MLAMLNREKSKIHVSFPRMLNVKRSSIYNSAYFNALYYEYLKPYEIVQWSIQKIDCALNMK